MRDRGGLLLLPTDGGSADKTSREAMPFVIFVATAWGPRFGGINSFNYSVAQAVAESGRARVVCVVSIGDEQDIQAASTHNIELLVRGFEPVDELIAALRRRLGHLSGQLVHWVGHDVHTGSIANSCAKLMGGVSSVVHHMDCSSYSGIKHGSKAADSKVRQQSEILQAADHLFAVGPLLTLSGHLLTGKKPIELIPGLPEVVSSDREEGPFKVMIVGRLGRDDDAIKQVRLGVKAVAAASSRRPDIDWLIELIGARPDDDGYVEDSATIEQIWTSETNAYFPHRFLPLDPDQDFLFERLSQADLLIMPSLREGFGLVAWEAIGAGVPVAISKRSGLYQLLHQNGYSGNVEPLTIKGRGVLSGEVDKGDVVTVTKAVVAVAGDRRAKKRRAMFLKNALRRDPRYTWASCAATLLDALQVPSLGVVAALTPPSVVSLNNPFKQDLAHWTVNEEKPLLGRTNAIRDILAGMANYGDFILLKGRSGCGKSSLMQSGVMRQLRELDGSVPVPFRPNEVMAGSGKGDALDRVTRLIAETTSLPVPTGGPKAMRPGNYAKHLQTALENNNVNLVLGLDHFEEIIDELKLESERTTGTRRSGWWLVIRFLKALCTSPRIRLIATLESAREKSFQNLRIGDAIGLVPKTTNVDTTDDIVAEIAQSGFARGGLPLDPAVIRAIKSAWRAFERLAPSDNASPLPLACLFFHRLYERFADQAGATASERLENAFSESDRAVTNFF